MRTSRSLVVKVVPNRTLQFGRAIAQHARQVLKIVASGDTELAHEVLCGGLEIAVVLNASGALLVFGTAKVGIGRDGLGAFEALQTCLGFGLRGWVVGAFAEELVGCVAFLVSLVFAGVGLGVVLLGSSVSRSFALRFWLGRRGLCATTDLTEAKLANTHA